ncbi:MAG: hypothetical protein R6V26_15010 [Roseovarius sp.]
MVSSYVISGVSAAPLDPQAGDCGLLPDAAIAASGDRIDWVGRSADLPEAHAWRDHAP